MNFLTSIFSKVTLKGVLSFLDTLTTFLNLKYQKKDVVIIDKCEVEKYARDSFQNLTTEQMNKATKERQRGKDGRFIKTD